MYDDPLFTDAPDDVPLDPDALFADDFDDPLYEEPFFDGGFFDDEDDFTADGYDDW